MKIQNVSKYTNCKGSAKPIKSEEHVKTKNYDVIEIKNKTQNDKEASKLNSIKQKVVAQINEETKAEKISRIKESVNNNTYKIDIEEIVNKLIK